MKDTEIHNGLHNKEIRDFFAKSIIDATSYPEVNKPQYYCSGWKYKMIHAQLELELHKKLLEKTKIRFAIEKLINEIGWKTFDVSDFVQKNRHTMSLIFRN